MNAQYLKDLEAVIQYGYDLKYVKEQTTEICLIAVKQDGYALEYVKEQTNEICLEALIQNKDALKYINSKFKQDPIIQLIINT